MFGFNKKHAKINHKIWTYKTRADKVIINESKKTYDSIIKSGPVAPGTTFIVDSDESFQQWADGCLDNDYTSVFIRKGTWNATSSVNLRSAGTKYIIGESGAHLVFHDVQFGIYYSDENNKLTDEKIELNNFDYKIENIHVSLIFNRNFSEYELDMNDNMNKIFGICNVKNIKNVTVSIIPSKDITLEEAEGFHCCNFMNHCIADMSAVQNENITQITGFCMSDFLINCNVVGSPKVQSTVIGYDGCNNLALCKCDVTTTNTIVQYSGICAHNTASKF